MAGSDQPPSQPKRAASDQLNNKKPVCSGHRSVPHVNQQGDVVKTRYQLRISDVSRWSDKVFSSAYQLRPLSQVATYVRQWGHLPGVPSAKQVKTEGVDLVKMNSLLLEKVEELTLYGIQQEKTAQQQQQTLQEQKDRIDKLERLVNQLMKKR